MPKHDSRATIPHAARGLDKRTAADILGSQHIASGNFTARSAIEFVADCPQHLGSLARLLGLLVRDMNQESPRTLTVAELALLANATQLRVRGALHELACAGHNVGCIK
ncbi:MAG: hypothetical protein ACEQSH_00390 [Bacteroidia bacterium]